LEDFGLSNSAIDYQQHSLMRIAGTRILIAALLAFILQMIVCLVEFRSETYMANRYVKLEAGRIVSAAKFQNQQLIIERSSALSHFAGPNADAYAYRVFSPSGKMLAVHNENLINRAAPGVPDRSYMLNTWLRKFDSEQEFFFSGAVTREISGKKVIIEIATAGDPGGQRVYGMLAYFWDDISKEFLPTIFLVSIFTLFSLRSAYQPMLHLARYTDKIMPGKEDPLFNTDGLPTEAASFASAINRLLARNRALLQSQQHLMATTAHELRTPLHVMMLELGNIEGPNARRLEEDVKDMSSRIDRLLALARLEMAAEPENIPIDLPQIVQSEIDRLMPLLKSRGNTIINKVTHQTALIGDPQSIREAVRNLIENASKHTPSGTEIMVSSDAGGQLVVEDSGGNLGDIDRNRLFDPFYRGATQTDGSGLGLSIVQQAVALHKGSVSLEQSKLGGARFVLNFGPA